METINNVATAAAKAVWGEGETHKEPVSGAQGNVEKGEPYDAGNLGVYLLFRCSPVYVKGALIFLTTASKDTPSQEKVEARLSNVGNDDGTNASDKPATTITTTTAGDTSSKQIDTRHPEKAAEEPEVLDPENLKGPGPKPVDVVAKEHGGDAGQSKKEPVQLSAGATNPTPSDDKKAQPGEEAATGTGEGYVKTTGFNADGGDFDATKPGAGKEADRKEDPEPTSVCARQQNR